MPGPSGISDWTERSWNAARACSESKLYVTALALTLARVWPGVLSNAVDPGWVSTRMGGAAATGDLELGHLTQTWLAVSNDAAATASGLPVWSEGGASGTSSQLPTPSGAVRNGINVLRASIQGITRAGPPSLPDHAP
jgi:NAD(P)-dependent dehydrogenase (short-subunit alcohol dehydrogenase family)